MKVFSPLRSKKRFLLLLRIWKDYGNLKNLTGGRGLGLAGGDLNTHFFHASTKTRRQRNQIVKLRDSSGQWFDFKQEVASLISDFYQDLFTKSHIQDLNLILSYIQPCINDSQND